MVVFLILKTSCDLIRDSILFWCYCLDLYASTILVFFKGKAAPYRSSCDCILIIRKSLTTVVPFQLLQEVVVCLLINVNENYLFEGLFCFGFFLLDFILLILEIADCPHHRLSTELFRKAKNSAGYRRHRNRLIAKLDLAKVQHTSNGIVELLHT